MFVDGKFAALTTGTDVETMKKKLFYPYFHLPRPDVPTRKRRRP